MNQPKFRSTLERKIFELILSFPERIDAMETRNEEASLVLARRIHDLVSTEMERQGSA